jgi:hypothetical protein
MAKPASQPDTPHPTLSPKRGEGKRAPTFRKEEGVYFLLSLRGVGVNSPLPLKGVGVISSLSPLGERVG